MEHAGISANRLLYSGNRWIVIRIRINANPVLTEVDAHNLFGQESLPDMRAYGLDSRDCTECLSACGCDPCLLGVRSAGRRNPVRKKVTLLERREKPRVLWPPLTSPAPRDAADAGAARCSRRR